MSGTSTQLALGPGSNEQMWAPMSPDDEVEIFAEIHPDGEVLNFAVHMRRESQALGASACARAEVAFPEDIYMGEVPVVAA